ncbi:MAG: serine hydrolase [Rickettsiales bacterium]|nr:serine hydrolase [Rickettsiales bacterium]
MRPKYPENLAIVDRVRSGEEAERYDEVFPIMSISKTFCGVISTLMAVDGKFGNKGIDAKLSEVLLKAQENYPARSDKIFGYLEMLENKGLSDVKISEILTHTSGIDDDRDTIFDAYKNETALKFFEDKLSGVREDFVGKYHYSNDGYTLMEEIINLASDSGNYRQELQEKIFDKLDLRNTKPVTESPSAWEKFGPTVFLPGHKIGPTTTIENHTIIRADKDHPLGQIPLASAGLCSTINDLKKYSVELLKFTTGKENVFTDKTTEVAEIYSKHLTERANGFYSIGICFVPSDEGNFTIFHGGGFNTNKSWMEVETACKFDDFKEGKKIDFTEDADLKMKIFMHQQDSILANVLLPKSKGVEGVDQFIIDNFLDENGIIDSEKIIKAFPNIETIDKLIADQKALKSWTKKGNHMKPSFKILSRLGNLDEEIFIPPVVDLADGRKLEYCGDKTGGGTAGAFYQDESGKKYIAKFSSYNAEKTDKQASVPRSEYYEVMLNNIFRSVLGDKAAPKETVIGHYSYMSEEPYNDGTKYPCFVASLVSGYKNISDFGKEEILGYGKSEEEEEKKIHREKFHKFFPLICLVMNDDIYDDNFGVDAEGNPINIDLGLTPPFLFREQQENISQVDQLASYISHNNPFGGQHFRRKFFEEVSYVSLLDGVKAILDNKDKLLFEVDKIIEQIALDDSIIHEQKGLIQENFMTIKSSLSSRITYLEEKFSSDLTDLEANRERFSSIKWKDYEKFQEILSNSRSFENKTATDAANNNIRAIAQILGIEGEDISELRKEIFAANISDKKDDLKKFAQKNWVLHIAAMNSDVDMTKWLLENDIADVSQRYMKRNHNIEYRAYTPLSIAISSFYDKRADHVTDLTKTQSMIKILGDEFLKKNPQAKEEGYEINPDNIWPLRMTKLSLERYEQDRAATVIQSAFKSHSVRKLKSEQEKGSVDV